MAKYTKPSLGDVLSRWDDPHVVGIDTETQSVGGLHGASLTIQSRTARIGMVVTNVEAEPAASLDEVQKAFDQVRHAPSDAALLASEVNRLTEEVRRLRESLADG